MATNESGHAKNVANFERLISYCVGYGTNYNPSKSNLKLAALQTQLASCSANIDSVTSSNVNYNNAVNARTQAFQGLRKLCTRIVNSLDATDASPETVKNAKSINIKVQGRGGAKLTKADAGKADLFDENNPVVETVKSISTSQQSYSNLTEHFSRMIAILSAEPTYLPNETPLQVTTLNTQLTTLKNVNTGVINAYTTLSNARLSRNESLYNPTNGLVQVAKEIKMYIKSLYGAQSPEFKQVSAINFTK